MHQLLIHISLEYLRYLKKFGPAPESCVDGAALDEIGLQYEHYVVPADYHISFLPCSTSSDNIDNQPC